jgi:hypothetical protein
MFPFDYLLAVALLSAPPEAPIPNVTPEEHARLQPLLQKLALAWEIMDPHEVGYLLSRPDGLAADLRFLRCRYRDYAAAPPLSDCLRFPPREVVSDLLTFNRAYRQHLETCMAVETVRWWEYREALVETDQLFDVYNSIKDARCDYQYVTARRQALQHLRELLGEVNYQAGCLPPHVPVWRFQRID